MINFISKLRRNKLALFGAIVILLIVILSIITPVLNLVNPNEVNTANRFIKPFNETHWLGTDHLGRDILSRLLWGTQLSLVVGFLAALFAAVIGSLLGIIAGSLGGRLDNIIMRTIDVLMSFPYVLLALAIVAVLGPSLMNALIAVAIVNIPFFARNVRGVTITLTNSDFINASRLSGRSQTQVLFFEIFPNVTPVIVVSFSTTVGWMILETAGLSFLGLGSQPPQSDLGSMLGDGRSSLIIHPHTSLIPGIMIFIIVMGINLLGDGIRDALDPRLNQGSLTRSKPMTDIARVKIPKKQSNALLEVNSLETKFKLNKNEFTAIENITFQVDKGECLAIVGESGSGKSVTALSIASLISSPPGMISNGSVWYKDEELIGLTYNKMRQLRGKKISYIFQDPLTSLHPLKTIGHQLTETIRTHRNLSTKDASRISVGLLEEVRISNPNLVMGSFPHQISGGMRQRIIIAMALSNNPDLIIADEPTTALDVTVQAQILNILENLRKERGLSVLFISHDLNVVSQISKKIIVMYAGEIVEYGDTVKILNKPLHPYTKALLNCSPDLNSKKLLISPIPGNPPLITEQIIGCKFAKRCSKKTSSCLEKRILIKKINDRQLRCINPV